jgi:hypothetical protein
MIIGLCGFKSSGKDTIAEYLVQEYGFKKLSFAGAIKDMLSILFGWSRDKLEGLTKEDREWREEIDPVWSKLLDMPLLSPRYAMQYLATELFRNHFHPDIWLKVVENQLNKYENIVISDCRFTNEINMIQKYGGKIIHVHRNIPSWFYSYQQGEEVEYIKNIHISEYQWIRTHKDYIIENNTSIEDLIKNINEIYIPLKKV